VALEPQRGAELAFGVLGDVPYSQAEVEKLDRLVAQMNRDALAFVVHVGDIGTSGRAQGCSDAWLQARQRQFSTIRHPFVLLPGDNEWSDCARHGMDPQARLAQWRRLFCVDVPGLALERQPGRCENLRWRAGGMLFVGSNVPGRGENPSAADDSAAALRWIEESLAMDAQRYVLFLHADPHFERNAPGDGYAPLRAALATHARRLAGRLVLVHGDSHLHVDDEPLPGLRRLEVWGSPFIAWLRLSVHGEQLRADVGW
jgi:hypothetical protein